MIEDSQTLLSLAANSEM